MPAQDKKAIKDLFNYHTYEGQRGLVRPVSDEQYEEVFKFVEHLGRNGWKLSHSPLRN